MMRSQIRFEDNLYAELTNAAAEDLRTMNAELVWLVTIGLKVRAEQRARLKELERADQAARLTA